MRKIHLVFLLASLAAAVASSPVSAQMSQAPRSAMTAQMVKLCVAPATPGRCAVISADAACPSGLSGDGMAYVSQHVACQAARGDHKCGQQIAGCE